MTTADVTFKTDSEINAMPAKVLLAYYNDLAEAMKLDPVRRFADTATGVKRTIKMRDDFKKLSPKVAPVVATAPSAASTPAPAAPKASKVVSARRGTNLVPLGHQPEPCREGTKQAKLLDMLARPQGATMTELLNALSGGNKPWTEATVRSGFGWDLKNKGYGVRSDFTPSTGTERFFIVLPAKFPTIPAHTPLKTSKPKAHAAQTRLEA